LQGDKPHGGASVGDDKHLRRARATVSVGRGQHGEYRGRLGDE
jgi:hypothetical protein